MLIKYAVFLKEKEISRFDSEKEAEEKIEKLCQMYSDNNSYQEYSIKKVYCTHLKSQAW